jgi:hypothetical protein
MSAGAGITLGAVNVEADDPRGLAAFWARLLGSEVAGGDEGGPSSSPPGSPVASRCSSARARTRVPTGRASTST